MKNIALIAGGTGACAKRLIEVLLADPDWTVVGLCRHPPAASGSERLAFVRADLIDAAGTRRALRDAAGVTHLFYTARAPHGEGGIESIDDNTSMLRNVLAGLLPVARGLEHVHLTEGGKYYGLHLGAYPTPAREDDPRPATPNFYYDQEDLLTERQRGQRWTWSASRPNVVCDFAPERARNLVPLLGAYAAVMNEMSLPLHFPGRPGCWQALTEVTDAAHLARAMVHMATDPRAANLPFNVSNGDLFRWQRLWPRLAAHFGMPVGDVRPGCLVDLMSDKGAVWQRIVARHGLAASRLHDLAVWGFGDFVFRQDHDVVSSTTRLRQAGFHDVVDTEAMFLAHLERYRAARLLP
ncbi:MAG: SDR family oxidoreductase [Betaproteobacteria bacterium]